jgi:site-specific recombinase XerD
VKRICWSCLLCANTCAGRDKASSSCIEELHTHAYELMMEGVEIPIIQHQLGHVSLATTAVYL